MPDIPLRSTLRLVCKSWENYASIVPFKPREPLSLAKFAGLMRYINYPTSLWKLLKGSTICFSLLADNIYHDLFLVYKTLNNTSLDKQKLAQLEILCASMNRIYAIEIKNSTFINAHYRCAASGLDDMSVLLRIINGCSSETLITLFGSKSFEEVKRKVYTLDQVLLKSKIGWAKLRVHGISFLSQIGEDIAPFIKKLKPEGIWLDGDRGTVLQSDLPGLNALAFSYISSDYTCNLTISFKDSMDLQRAFQILHSVRARCSGTLPFAKLELKSTRVTYSIESAQMLVRVCKCELQSLGWKSIHPANLELYIEGLLESLEVYGKYAGVGMKLCLRL